MNGRPLLGVGIALILSAVAGGCGREDEKPALRVLDLPGASLSVAVGEGAVWVANYEDDTVLRIDPRSLKVVAEIPVGRDPFSVATGEGAVWVVDRFGTSTRVDPRSNRAVDKPLVEGRLMAVAVGEGSVWPFEARVGQLLRIDPLTNTLLSTSNKIVQRGPATSDYAGVAVGAGSVWVVSPGEGTVVRMDPRSGRPVATIRVGAGPVSVAVAGGTVWVANLDDGTVTRVDARTNRVVGKPVAVGGRPVAVAVGGGAVWVASGTGGGAVSHDVMKWYEPDRGYLSVEVEASWGGRNTVALMTLDPIPGGTLVTNDMHFDADDLAAAKTAIDEALVDIAENLVVRFGGRLIERYVEE